MKVARENNPNDNHLRNQHAPQNHCYHCHRCIVKHHLYILTQYLNGSNVHHTHYWVQLEIGVWISLLSFVTIKVMVDSKVVPWYQ